MPSGMPMMGLFAVVCMLVAQGLCVVFVAADFLA
jgi:hypothetical protein